MKLNSDLIAITDSPGNVILWNKTGGERLVLDAEALKNLFVLAVDARLIDAQKIMAEIYDK